MIDPFLDTFRWKTWKRVKTDLEALGFKSVGDASNGSGIVMQFGPCEADPDPVLEAIGFSKEGVAWIGTRFEIRVERTGEGGVKAMMVTHHDDWTPKLQRYFNHCDTMGG